MGKYAWCLRVKWGSSGSLAAKVDLTMKTFKKKRVTRNIDLLNMAIAFI